VHNGGIRGDRSSNDIISVGEVHDNDLILFPDFFTHTYEMVRLKRQGLKGSSECRLDNMHEWSNLESYRRRLNVERGELEVLAKSDGF
jgi:hypothetical protein